MSTSIAAGVTSGLAEVADYARTAPERDMRMQEAKNRSQLSQMKLQEYQQQAPMRQSQQELQVQQLQNELYKAQANGLQAQTFNAFKLFDGDGNTRHLNTFLQQAKRNPLGAKMYGGVTRYDNVTRSPETERMLRAAGVADIEGYFEAPQDYNFVLATTAEGTQELINMDQVYAGTGYTSYMEDQQLDRLSKRALATQRLQSGQTRQQSSQLERLAELYRQEDPSLTKVQAIEKANEAMKGGGVKGSETERIANSLMEENPELTPVDAMEQAISMKRNQGKITEDQRKINEVNQAKDQLDEAFGGNFMTADLTKSENRHKASRLASRIEQEFPLSTADRKTVTEVRQLTSLGGEAGEQITDAEAGPIDSLLRGVKKYISNDIEGTAGTSAYETFRNTLRHALYGATLSSGEIGAFNSAMGSLAEQKGPVLAKLRTQMTDLREQLQSVYDLNDPYVSKYRLNMSQDDLAGVITALDERLEMIEGVPSDKDTVVTPALSLAEQYDAYKKGAK